MTDTLQNFSPILLFKHFIVFHCVSSGDTLCVAIHVISSYYVS